jgi:myo-inositol 2-dehydrogenase / D-chiro-inositol 1-dehydrogenase
MLKVAVIGTGFIGSVHAKNIARHPGAELVAVSDANIEFAKKIAATTGAKAITDIAEIFTNKEIQAVLIATPTDTHVDYLKRAADAGKAIYCEKPIGLDYKEAEQAVGAVRAAGVPAMLGFNRRFDASHAAVKEAVDRGDVGKVEIVQLTSRGPKPPPISYVKVSRLVRADRTELLRCDRRFPEVGRKGDAAESFPRRWFKGSAHSRQGDGVNKDGASNQDCHLGCQYG